MTDGLGRTGSEVRPAHSTSLAYQAQELCAVLEETGRKRGKPVVVQENLLQHRAVDKLATGNACNDVGLQVQQGQQGVVVENTQRERGDLRWVSTLSNRGARWVRRTAFGTPIGATAPAAACCAYCACCAC